MLTQAREPEKNASIILRVLDRLVVYFRRLPGFTKELALLVETVILRWLEKCIIIFRQVRLLDQMEKLTISCRSLSEGTLSDGEINRDSKKLLHLLQRTTGYKRMKANHPSIAFNERSNLRDRVVVGPARRHVVMY